MPLSAGEKLGPYEILSPIGAGGMGEVYRARDTRLDRVVAIKTSKEHYTERFTREARTIAALNHPNVCHLYDVGLDYIVLEYVEGATLQGPLAVAEAMPVIQQLIDGIEAAHEKNIIHRDLKPANIKITPDGVVKILDFGLAKAMEPTREDSNPEDSPTMTVSTTQAGTILGTAAFMSPEQVKGKTADKRSDIWSFGVIVYELLTGKRAFQGETAAETLGAVLHKEPDWDPVPARMRKLLQRCLQKDRKLRLSAIGDARWMMEEEGRGDAPSRSRLGKESRLGSFAPWMIAGVALLALIALATVHFREKPRVPLNPVRFQFTPEKVSIGAGYFFALSPDGTKLAYYAIGTDGVVRLWIHAMDSLESRALPAADLNPSLPIFWSDDSRFVFFQSVGKLKKIDISGGTVQSLCDAPELILGGSSNREGTVIFGSSTGPVMRVPSEGGTATPATALDSARAESAHPGPVFLPDGRHFLYLRTGNPETTGIYIGSIDARPEQQSSRRLLATQYVVDFVPSEDGRSGEILFLREGTLLAQPFDLGKLSLSGEAVPVAEQVGSYRRSVHYSASWTGALVYRSGGAAGSSKLAWFDRQGAMIGTPTDAFYASYTVALSPDDSRAVVEHPEAASNLWLVDLARGDRTRFTYTRSGFDRFAVWSPDGTRIAFSSNRNGHNDLYERAANGGGEDRLLFKSASDAYLQDWSRDGRFLLFVQRNVKGGADLWVLPMSAEGDHQPIPFLRSDFVFGQARFSPDGRWVAYSTNESGAFEVYVRPFPAPAGGGGKWIVSKGSGAFPRWRDGKELFYSRPDGEVMAVAVRANGNAFEAGAPKELFKTTVTYGWDVSRDGKKFLLPIDSGETARAPFTVVLNWTSMLKK